MTCMNKHTWRIYIDKIPYKEKGNFWVSFESDPGLKTTKANIYGRCLPCIQNLYIQLKEGRKAITLGTAYTCWKITAVMNGIEECLSLLHAFEKKFPLGHVYGKLGSGRTDAKTTVVVFHTDSTIERDRIRDALAICLPSVTDSTGEIAISRACGILYDDILGDWRQWQPKTKIKHPENVGSVLKRIARTLYMSEM